MTGATCDTANERRIMLLERGHDELKEAVMSLSTSQKSISESGTEVWSDVEVVFED